MIVEGQQLQATGQICRQPDGSWWIIQNTPGLPQQVYILPAQLIYVTPYPYEYYWVNSWGFGPPFCAGGFFFADRFHYFRHKYFSHAGFHGGVHGGAHRGFHGGSHR